jgi:hypothetical protein
MVQRLAPFWKQVANREERRSFLERTLVVAQRLESSELAAALLQPFILERLTPKTAPKLAALSQRYGIAWCQAVLGTWASEGRRHHSSERNRAAWMASFPSLRRQLGDDGSGPAYDLAR